MQSVDTIKDIESEAGVVATIISHPNFVFFSEHLLPDHFSDRTNGYIYEAVRNLAQQGIERVDAYNIITSLRNLHPTKPEDSMAKLQEVQEIIEVVPTLSRETAEEYRLLTDNIVDASLRRKTFRELGKAQGLCFHDDIGDIERRIYSILDNTFSEYASVSDIPTLGDVAEDMWAQIVASHGESGVSGLPFKFKTLNKYVTLEQGELIVFAAKQKQGKSIMMLNCAHDISINQGKSVLYIDSELNTKLFTCRMISYITGIEFRRVKSGEYSKDEEQKIYAALEVLKTAPLTHVYMPMFDAKTIYTTAKKMMHTRGLDVIIIDYFKSSSEGDAFSTYQELGALVDMVKNKICGDMGVCGIGACQATESGRVADSSKIIRNASTIILLQDKTQEEIQRDGISCGNKKLSVEYNRNGSQHSNGEYIDLMFVGNLISYEEAQQHFVEEPY